MIERWLASRACALHLVVLSTLVCLVSLGNGIVADDMWHYATFTRAKGFEPFFHPWPRLFTFFPNEQTVRWFMDEGFAPWWTDPEVHAVLFRPLSSGTHAIDYALFPHTPWLMHLHSVLWAGAMVAVAAWVYRRFLGLGWTAGLATFLYAFDPGHGMPIGWLANRNAIVAAVFGIAALGAYDVGVRRPSRMHVALSAALLAAALASGESGAAIVAFVAAYALTFDERPWRARFVGLAPHVVVTLAWVAIYRLGNYGVAHSGMYVEPMRAPLAFIRACCIHLPLLVGMQLGSVPPELYEALDGAPAAAIVVTSVIVTTWALAAGRHVLRTDRRARFFLVAGVLATLPVCATFSSGRLMIIPGLPLIGLVALVAEGARTRLARSYVAWGVWLRAIVTVPFFALALLIMRGFDTQVTRLAAGMPDATPPQPAHVVIVNTPDAIFSAFLVARGRLADPPTTYRVTSLASGRRAITLRREDDHTIVVHVEGGVYRVFTELLGRRADSRMPRGTVVALRDVRVEVLHAMDDGVPDEMSFRFELPLDDVTWRTWRGSELLPWRPPPIGETASFAGAVPTPF